MNKKVYEAPEMNIVELEVSDIVCQSVNDVAGKSIYKYGGGGDGTGDTAGRGRDRGNPIWDED